LEFTDDAHPAKSTHLLNLGICQRVWFEHIGDLPELDSSITNLTNAVQLIDDTHPKKPLHLCNLGSAQKIHFERLGKLSDLEYSIANVARAVELTDDAHSHKPDHLLSLGIIQRTRFSHLHEESDLENSIATLTKAIGLTNNTYPIMPRLLSSLGISQNVHFRHFSKLADLNDAISSYQEAVQLTENTHPDKPSHLSNLGNAQQAHFEHLGELSNLKDSIANLTWAVKLTDDAIPNKAKYLSNLGDCQRVCFKHLNRPSDRDASVSSFKSAAQSETAFPNVTLHAARHWSDILHSTGDLQVALDGYRRALEILPRLAWLGLDTHARQDWLTEEKSKNLSCLVATCAIQLGLLEEAVELLDFSRSLIWQQGSSLRSDLETLKEEEPELAKRFELVGRQLDAVNFPGSSIGVDHCNTKDIGKECRRQVAEWEDLLDRVRRLPRFKDFLRPIAFQQLRQVATKGQVVIINVSQYGVDALSFSTSGPIVHVPLTNIDFDTLTQLSSGIFLN